MSKTKPNKNRKKLSLQKDSLRDLSHDALAEANGATWGTSRFWTNWTGMCARCQLLPVNF